MLPQPALQTHSPLLASDCMGDAEQSVHSPNTDEGLYSVYFVYFSLLGKASMLYICELDPSEIWVISLSKRSA